MAEADPDDVTTPRARSVLVVLVVLVLVTMCGCGTEGSSAPGLDIPLEASQGTLLPHCRDGATQLSFAVPCPTRVPVGSVPNLPAPYDDWEKLVFADLRGLTFSISAQFPGVPGYEGLPNTNPPQGHLVILAYPDTVVVPDDHIAMGCPASGAKVREVEVRRRPGRLIECPEASEFHGSHELVLWSEGSAVYAVSAHGHNATNERLVLAVANGLRLVG